MQTQTAPMRVGDLPSGALVEVYIKLRDRRAQRKAAYENEDAGDKTKQARIESLLLQRFQAEGIDSIKSPAGTAYTTKRTSVSLADPDVYLDWVKANDAWDFLDRKANKTAVVAYREQHDDLPPGVNWSEELVVGVRRS
jgi:hypothetical protein